LKRLFASALLSSIAITACGAPTPIVDTRGPGIPCDRSLAGIGDWANVDLMEVKIPSGCTILSDDNSVQVSRRTVTVISDERTFLAACGLSVDASPGSSGIDFSKVEILLVRVPDYVGPVWVATKGGMYTVGENTVACRGVAATATRYLLELPRAAPVKFFSCPPPPCGNEGG
jgi:hypothetical protein